MSVHSANPVGRQRMEFAIQMIYHHLKVTQPVAGTVFRPLAPHNRGYKGVSKPNESCRAAQGARLPGYSTQSIVPTPIPQNGHGNP